MSATTRTELIAKIERATLGWEDHGIFTVSLTVDYGGSGQNIGGYALDAPRRDEDGKFLGRFGSAFGMEFIIHVMRACGVDEWSKVAGRTILVLKDGDDWGPVVGIKALPTERGKTFVFADLVAEMASDAS